MTTRRPLLAAVDELDRTNPAIDAGLALSDALGCTLEVVHAMGIPGDPELDAHTALHLAMHRGELIDRRKDALEARLQPFFTAYGRSASSHLHVRGGKPSVEVLEQARESQAELLVLGPHEPSGRLDWGSTSRALLAAAPCSVWTQPVAWRPVRRVLVPIDLSDDSLRALDKAVELAKVFDAQITCLHAWFATEVFAGLMGELPMGQTGVSIESGRKAAEGAFHEALATVDFQGIPWEAEFCEDRAVSAILSREGRNDLIAMGSHGRTGLASAVLGNVTYRVLVQARVPVLAIR